jgi:hypothetical protein
MANDQVINICIRVALITVAAVIIIVLITYYSKPHKEIPEQNNTQNNKVEKFNTEQPKQVQFSEPVVTSTKVISDTPVITEEQPLVGTSTSEPMPYGSNGTEDYIAVDYIKESEEERLKQFNDSFFPQDKTKPEDLLPRNAANSKWAQVAPAGQGDVKNQNFLTAGFLVGKDTVGVAKKNPNLTLRAEPANPKVAVSPWMNSTIEPDQFRRGFEIGSSA